jgi:hypothetical protein
MKFLIPSGVLSHAIQGQREAISATRRIPAISAA